MCANKFHCKYIWKFTDKNSFCLVCGWNKHSQDKKETIDKVTQTPIHSNIDWDDSDVPLYDSDQEDNIEEERANWIIKNVP
jgi:hypothetical protein